MVISRRFSLTAWLRKIKIRYRLTSSFILLSMLPLLISGYISYVESSKAIAKNTRAFSVEIVKQVAKNVELQMAQIESDSEALVLSDQVQSLLSHYASENTETKGRARTEIAKILLDAYGSFDYINQKYFLDKNKNIVDSQVFPQLSRGVELFASKVPHSLDRIHWGTVETLNGQKNIVMLREIYFKANNKLAGSLYLGIRSSHFSGIFDDVDLGVGSDIYILDSQDASLIAKTQEKTAISNNKAANRVLLGEISKSLAQGKQTGFITYDNLEPNVAPEGKKILAAFSQIPRTNWIVVSAIPYKNLLIEAESARDKIIFIGCICFFCAIIFGYLISRSISAPLGQLVNAMKETETGNFGVDMSKPGSDELTELAKKFNEMSAKINRDREQLEEHVAERTRELEEANRKLAALSMTDALTGISNRRRFDEVLMVEFRRAIRTGKPLALMMLDVDFFKNYNDHYGHQEGDACLRKVARLLQSHASRASDTVARYGGEEFVMLSAETDVNSAMTLAEKIRQSLEDLGLPHAQSSLACVTTSIGVAVWIPDEDQTPEMFIRMADKAMYQAKAQGRNQVVLSAKK